MATIRRPQKRVVSQPIVAKKKVAQSNSMSRMDDHRPNQEQEGFDRNDFGQNAEVFETTESAVVDRQMEQDAGERPKKKIAQHRSAPMMDDRHLSEDVVDEDDLVQDDGSLEQDEEGIEGTEGAGDRQSRRSTAGQYGEDRSERTLARPRPMSMPEDCCAGEGDDDFDLNDFTSSTGVLREKKTVTVKLASYLDSRNYYRVHPDDIQESVYCCECKDENDNAIFYLVSEDVAEDVEAKTGGDLKLVTLARLLDSTGAEIIYLAAEPDPSRSDLFNQYATTRAEFLAQARESWASLQNNKGAYRYDVKLAGERTQKMLDAKDFSSRLFRTLIKEVFEGRIVKNQDHPLLQEDI